MIKQKILRLVPAKIRFIYFELKKKLRDGKLSKVYSGNDVKCVICGSEYSIFMPHRERKNVRCLNCDSFGRDRLLYLYLKKAPFFDKKIRLLHFAPEKPLYHLFSKAKNFDYVPVDIDPALYNYGGKTKILKADITAIPYEDNSFDVIICNHVLEHIPDDNLAMTELFRVMKKGGWGIFQVPIDYSRDETYEDPTITSPEERAIEFWQYDHVRLYGKDYVNRLGAVGFDAKEDAFITSFSDDDIFKYGFKDNELIYKVTK